MTATGLDGGSPDLRDELLQLVRPGIDTGKSEDGYFDVLGKLDAVGPRPGQQVFRSRLLPLVYERIWRPLVGLFFFGWGLKAKAERRLTLKLLSGAKGNRIVDVGCGPGNYTRELARIAGNGLVVGVDASEAMLATAVKRGGGENLVYLRADASRLPFANERFDGVCSVGVVHMLEDPMQAVAEMTRVLAPGGRLVIVASCGKGAASKRRGSIEVFSRTELTNALEGHGLVGIEQHVVRRAQFVAGRKPVKR